MNAFHASSLAEVLDLAERCEDYCIRDGRKSAQSGRAYDRTQFERWEYLMRVPEVDDRDNPEFPLFNRRWPATSTKPITVAQRQILLKDESECDSGTFKDRAAHEIVLRLYYNDRIRPTLINGGPYELPALSLISWGSMAVALQTLCLRLQLPDVRVLMDSTRHEPGVVTLLRSLGAKVYLHDLSQKALSDAEVLFLTDNVNGIDVTTRNLDQILSFHYYDWCCHEILDSKPRHIFVPFGSGELFANLVSVIENLRLGKGDRRFIGKTEELYNIDVYGATTYEPLTRMTKLYADYRPALPAIEALVERCKQQGFLGDQSGIYPVGDDWADGAHRELNGANQHICTELSAVAGLALFLNRARLIPPDETVLVVNTGRIYVPRSH